MLLIIIVGFSLYYSYVLLVDILSSDNIIYEYVLKDWFMMKMLVLLKVIIESLNI